MNEVHFGEYVISTDKARLDTDVIHAYLSRESYWAQGRSREAVLTSIDHSLCFGIYREREEVQVGFARVVTDYATFAWLCDVFVLEPHRGLGLGKRLVAAVTEHDALRSLRLMILATRNAQSLYQRAGGFRLLERPERWMTRRGSSDAPECAR
jgi:GNAT superfamily N-acetyltransferase